LQVSGKVWKGPGTKAGTYKSAIVGTTWEKKMAAKATKKVLSEQKAIAVGALKAKRKVRCCVSGAREGGGSVTAPAAGRAERA
jgi:hypothetical protein